MYGFESLVVLVVVCDGGAVVGGGAAVTVWWLVVAGTSVGRNGNLGGRRVKAWEK